MRFIVLAAALAFLVSTSAFHPTPLVTLTQAPTCHSSRTSCRIFLRMAAQPFGDVVSRRSILGVALFAPLVLGQAPAEANKMVVPFILKQELRDLVKAEPDWGPTLVRLAWHSSGTYDKMTNSGGSGKGTIRFKEELSHGANAGLDKAIAKLEPIKDKYPFVSYADLYTLAGAMSIEALGGPDIPWKGGRVDSMDPKDATPDGRLPDADKGSPEKTNAHLREIFGRMGFNDQELVALAGAHALGRCHAEASGYVGITARGCLWDAFRLMPLDDRPWSPTPTMFNNAYFTLLLNLKWEPNTVNGKFQYKDPSGKLMMLPSDIALIQDEGFKKYVELYAKDGKRFNEDFASAFGKLLALGTGI